MVIPIHRSADLSFCTERYPKCEKYYQEMSQIFHIIFEFIDYLNQFSIKTGRKKECCTVYEKE